MAKGDRANLERLLRRAWELQTHNQMASFRRDAERKFTPKEWVLMAIGVIVALPGFALEDPYIIGSSLVLSWIVFVYLCKIHASTKRLKVISICSVTLLFGLLGGRIAVVERDQVRNKLEISANWPPDGEPFHAVFSFSNGSDLDLGKHQVFCSPTRVVSDKYWVLDFSQGASYTPVYPVQFELRAGQSQSDVCLGDLFKIGKVVCADILVGMDYEISGLPFLKDKKEVRFVFVPNKSNGWVKEPIDYKGSYCALP